MAAYARVAVARSSGGFTVVDNVANLAAVATFAEMAGGAGGTVSYFGLGTDSSGNGTLIFKGTVTPNIIVVAGVTPKLKTTTTFTQSASDGMTTAAANAFLLLLLDNIDWANVGDPSGLQNSATAGFLYLSLHTSDPGEAGNQATNEISYT
jgi:hypothetical protein